MKRRQKLFNYQLTAKAISYVMRIILASQSPRRKKLLELFGFSFEVSPSAIQETSSESDPVKLVEDLAHQKAVDIALSCPNSLIIGADTIVLHNGNILGKPKNAVEASKMLNELSGTQHSVHTGVALIETNEHSHIKNSITFSEKTEVTFDVLNQNEIDHYIATGSPMDKAGSYGIQDDWGALFVKKLHGDYYNVVGLPLNRLYSKLKAHFPYVLTHIKSIP